MSRRQKHTHNSQAWQTFATGFASWQANPVSRRQFVQRMGILSAGMFLPVTLKAATATQKQLAPAPAPWPTIAAVQEQLFPKEPDSPGASDINAASYLKNLIDEPQFDRHEQNFILNGPTWLNDLANNQHGKPFPQLSSAQQQQLLQEIAQSTAGENWLSLLLSYIFEALLSSPIYGGNPDGIGWRWLEHNPGFPQPNATNTYQKLWQK